MHAQSLVWSNVSLCHQWMGPRVRAWVWQWRRGSSSQRSGSRPPLGGGWDSYETEVRENKSKIIPKEFAFIMYSIVRLKEKRAYIHWLLVLLSLCFHGNRITVIVHVGCENLKNTCELVRQAPVEPLLPLEMTVARLFLFSRPSMPRRTVQLLLVLCLQHSSSRLPLVMCLVSTSNLACSIKWHFAWNGGWH